MKPRDMDAEQMIDLAVNRDHYRRLEEEYAASANHWCKLAAARRRIEIGRSRGRPCTDRPIGRKFSP